MEGCLERGVKAVAPGLIDHAVPSSRVAHELVRMRQRSAGVAVIAQDRAAEPIKSRISRGYEIKRVARPLVHDHSVLRSRLARAG